MFNLILLSLSFAFFLFVYWKKWKSIDLGFILISFYLIISIAGVFYYLESSRFINYQNFVITFWPYFYLFLMILIFFRPFFINHQKIYDLFIIKNEKILYVFSLIFCGSAAISIIYQLPKVLENIESGDWLLIRDTLYYDDEFKLYDNQIERFAKVFIQYFRLPATIAYFYYLSGAKKRNYRFRFFLGLAIFLPSIFTSIETAARGSLLAFLIDMLIGFFIFKKIMSHKLKKRIYFSGAIVLIIIISFSMAVTISRFGEINQSSSVFYYFSHSFMSFNYGVADSIHSFANGKYFFNNFFENKIINHSSYGIHSGTSFITFVGTLYIDFGPIGTFFIALIVPFLISLKFKYKTKIDFTDLYLYSFYLSYLFNGVFVVGRGNSLDWIIAILFIIILKIFKI
jgi:oligosaccharide repeat unit polymerase